MTKFGVIAALSVAAFAGIALSNAEAVAGPIVPAGHYCMEEFGEQMSDCSFTTYAQCQASASGLDAECSGAPVEYDRARFQRHRSR